MRVICGTLQRERERESLIWMLFLLSVQHTYSCWKTSWEGAKRDSSQWHELPKGKTKFTNCVQHSTAFSLCHWLCWGQQLSLGPEGRRRNSSGQPSPSEILGLPREEQKSCEGSEMHLLTWDTKTTLLSCNQDNPWRFCLSFWGKTNLS